MEIMIEVVGWTGSVAVLVAYGMNSYQKLKSDSLWFYLLNLTGGFLLVIYTTYKEAYASAFINVVWVIIPVIAIAKTFSRKQSKT